MQAVALIVGAGLAIAVPHPLVILHWQRRCGATSAKASQSLPGDERVPHPSMASTRAITTQAPAKSGPGWCRLATAAAVFTATTGSRTSSAATSAAPTTSSPSCRASRWATGCA